MDGFIIFIFVLVFIIIPILSKSGKKPKPKVDRQRQKSGMKRDKYGHSDARARSHQNLHAGDNAKVFPDTHAGRVKARQARDRRSRADMERNIHGAKNRGVIRASNKGRDDWGTRGDRGMTSTKVLVSVVLLIGLAYIVLSTFAPELLDFKRF